MKNHFINLGVLGCLFLLCPAVLAAGMTSTNFNLKTSVISGGGGFMGSAGYSANSVLGQPSPIMSQDDAPMSTGFFLYPGFIYTIRTQECPWSLDGDGDVDGTDLFIFIQGYPGSFDGGDLGPFSMEFGRPSCN